MAAAPLMAHRTFALAFTTLASVSTGLGANTCVLRRYRTQIWVLFVVGGILVTFSANDMSKRRIGHMLSFSTGVMLYLSFVDLFGDASEKIGAVHANIGVSVQWNRTPKSATHH